MKCEFVSGCKNKVTHFIQTKVGDFHICKEHAEMVIQNNYEEVRYVEVING